MTKAPFKLLYNNDGMNVRSASPFHALGAPITDATVAGSIDEVAKHGVAAYMLCAGFGHYPWYPGEPLREHYRWWQEKTGLEPDAYGTYLLAGGDWMRILIERCRLHKMAAFASFRVNDVHWQEFAGEPHAMSQRASRFYTENPQYWIEPEHKTKWPEGYHNRRGLNWAEPAVREYKSGLITDLCRSYDIDGLELDFLRDPCLFRDEVPVAERIAIITAFVRRVRETLDRSSRDGRRRWLCARVPLELKRWAESGLDVRELVMAGVDMLNCSGWLYTMAGPDLAAIRKLAPGTAIYQEMTHISGNMVFAAPHGAYGWAACPRTWDQEFYTVANMAYAQGADGISLFNFAFYRDGRVLSWLKREPPFHVLPRLRDPEWLSKQPQVYWLGQWIYHNQFYSGNVVRPKKPCRFRFDVALPNRPLTGTTRLRLHAADPIAGKLVARFNGVVLKPADDLSGFFSNPYDGMLSDAPRRKAWRLPVELVREGRNEMEVRLAGEAGVQVTWLDFAIP